MKRTTASARLQFLPTTPPFILSRPHSTLFRGEIQKAGEQNATLVRMSFASLKPKFKKRRMFKNRPTKKFRATIHHSSLHLIQYPLTGWSLISSNTICNGNSCDNRPRAIRARGSGPVQNGTIARDKIIKVTSTFSSSSTFSYLLKKNNRLSKRAKNLGKVKRDLNATKL